MIIIVYLGQMEQITITIIIIIQQILIILVVIIELLLIEVEIIVNKDYFIDTKGVTWIEFRCIHNYVCFGRFLYTYISAYLWIN